MGFSTKSGEVMEFNIQRRAEGLQEPFKLKEDIIIPAGEYWQTRYEMQGSTFRSRLFSLATNVNWGKFYAGKSTESEIGVQWRTSRFVNINLAYEKNWVNVPQGRFTTDLINNRIDYAINPNVFGSFLTQWNNADKEINLNYRLQIIPKIGTDFYLIVNQLYDTSDSRWKLTQTVIIGKLIWRLVL